MILVDYEKIQKFLTDCCDVYELTAPTVHRYAEDLYQRIQDGSLVELEEIHAIQQLKEDGEWLHPNYAANRVFKTMKKVGANTFGHAGF